MGLNRNSHYIGDTPSHARLWFFDFIIAELYVFELLWFKVGQFQ